MIARIWAGVRGSTLRRLDGFARTLHPHGVGVDESVVHRCQTDRLEELVGEITATPPLRNRQ